MSDPAVLVVSRVFPVPPEQVFAAWSSAAAMRRWFSPERCAVAEAEVEFRLGGRCDITMLCPGHEPFLSRGVFTVLDPPHRLAVRFAVGHGEAVAFVADTEVTFEPVAEGTRMTVRQGYEIRDPAFATAVEGANEGWRTTLDKLAREVGPRTAVHDSFTLTRDFPASPARVFAAFADPAAKARWFVGGYETLERFMDVREGGQERLSGRWPNGMVSSFDALYLDVIADRRLVYAYTLHLDDRKISVSLATLSLAAIEGGTRLVLTEQGTFLDGYQDAGAREQGTAGLLGQLAAFLAQGV